MFPQWEDLLLCSFVNEEYLGFGVLVGQKKPFKHNETMKTIISYIP